MPAQRILELRGQRQQPGVPAGGPEQLRTERQPGVGEPGGDVDRRPAQDVPRPGVRAGRDHGLVRTATVEPGEGADPQRRGGGGRRQQHVVAAEQRADASLLAGFGGARPAQHRAAQQPPHAGRPAGAPVQQRRVGHPRRPLPYPGGGARHEREADQPVLRVGLLDEVAEPGEGAGHRGHRSPYVRVERRGGGGERRLPGQRDAQAAGVAADGLAGRERRRAVQVAGVAAARRVQQQRRVLDGAGQRADTSDALERFGVRPGGEGAALRFDADQMRPGGGDTDRARAVGAERGGDQARGDGGGRTAGGAARGVVEMPGVAGVPEGGALGERPLAQLARVGLADDDRTGCAQPPYHLGVVRLDGELPGAAERGGLARDIHVVLDRHRYAEERQPFPGREPAVGVRGFRLGGLGAQAAEGVDGGRGGGDAVQAAADERGGGGLTAGQRGGLAGEPFRRSPGTGQGGAALAALAALVDAHGVRLPGLRRTAVPGRLCGGRPPGNDAPWRGASSPGGRGRAGRMGPGRLRVARPSTAG